MMTSQHCEALNGCRGAMIRALAAVFFLSACHPPVLRTPVPLETVFYERPAAGAGGLLIVYLPGNGDIPASFERHGLINAVRERGIRADIIAVNAHLGYYREGSVVRRLKEDVIDPAKRGGYDRIWFVGNSLGAYGSLAYLADHPKDVAGVVLLGPYVGERSDLDDVRKGGGLGNWDPGPVEPTDWKRKLLLLLKDILLHPGTYPPIYLGYGTNDRFGDSQRFLAELLPRERVIEMNGGHEWRTWSSIWRLFLEKGVL